MIPILVFVTFLMVSVMTYWLLSRKSLAERRQLEERLSSTLTMSNHVDDLPLLVLRKELMSEIPSLNQWLLSVGLATRLRKIIEQADVSVTVMRLSMLTLIAGLLGGMAASLFTRAWILILVTGLTTSALPFGYVWRKRQTRLNAFLALLPDALELMSRGLSAGHAFTEALHMVATEMPEPVAGEFGKTYEEQNLGLSYKLALKNMTARIPLLDLRLCVTAILIQRETGGNLAEILEKVAQTIRERFRILEDLKTLTTSSRMSAWVLCGLPLFIAIMVSFMNPDYLDPLWHDARGQKLVYLAAFMQLIGMLLIRKIMRIRI